MRQLPTAEQRGASLVELLVALPIAALILAGVAGILFQLSSAHVYATNIIQCDRELQRAGDGSSEDAAQAQSVNDGNFSNAGTVQIAAAQDGHVAGTEVFVVQWADWNNNVQKVSYSLLPVGGSPLSTLQRTVQLNGSTIESHIAAEHIDNSLDPATLLPLTRFEWTSSDKQVVRMIVTSEYGDQSVTRVYEVRPRSMV